MDGALAAASIGALKHAATKARTLYLAAQQPAMTAMRVPTDAEQAVWAAQRARQELLKLRS